MKKTLSLMLACLIAVLCLPVGIFADTPDFELPEIDQLRIRAFLDTETNVPGVTNDDSYSLNSREHNYVPHSELFPYQHPALQYVHYSDQLQFRCVLWYYGYRSLYGRTPAP